MTFKCGQHSISKTCQGQKARKKAEQIPSTPIVVCLLPREDRRTYLFLGASDHSTLLTSQQLWQLAHSAHIEEFYKISFEIELIQTKWIPSSCLSSIHTGVLNLCMWMNEVRLLLLMHTHGPVAAQNALPFFSILIFALTTFCIRESWKTQHLTVIHVSVLC